MKLIIIEGCDRLGKSSLIKGLCEHFDYDNISIRHFGKPPSDMSPEEVLDFQFKCFNKELTLFKHINIESLVDRYHYYPETMIWNRSHLGEYVYSQMFRKGDPQELKEKLLSFERSFKNEKVYLITLTSDPIFFHSRQQDGHSLSVTLDQKVKELELFKEAHEFSLIKNKIIIKVNKDDFFRSKQEILDEVIEFIK